MLPQDPVILLSYLNTLLRDRYPSLSALCEDLDESEEALKEKLAVISYAYNAAANQFLQE